MAAERRGGSVVFEVGGVEVAVFEPDVVVRAGGRVVAALKGGVVVYEAGGMLLARPAALAVENGVVYVDGVPVHDASLEELVARTDGAYVYRGRGYVRLALDPPRPLPADLREYLEKVAGEIAARQAREGVPEGERARLDVTETPDGAIAEVRVTGLHTTLDTLKAEAALRFAADILAGQATAKAQARG